MQFLGVIYFKVSGNETHETVERAQQNHFLSSISLMLGLQNKIYWESKLSLLISRLEKKSRVLPIQFYSMMNQT